MPSRFELLFKTVENSVLYCGVLFSQVGFRNLCKGGVCGCKNVMVPLALSVSINVLWLENLKRQFVLPNGFPRPHPAAIEHITAILR